MKIVKSFLNAGMDEAVDLGICVEDASSGMTIHDYAISRGLKIYSQGPNHSAVIDWIENLNT